MRLPSHLARRIMHRMCSFYLALILLALSCLVWPARISDAATPAPPMPRYTPQIAVVFIGDSITYYWPLASAFPNTATVNKGMAGQDTWRMAARFQTDVIALHPRFVHILAGTNDICNWNTYKNTTFSYNGHNAAYYWSPSAVQGWYTQMINAARANGITPVIASVLPSPTACRPDADIRALNSWLRSTAAANGLRYVDYYSAFVGKTATLLKDGLHPNSQGYQAMDAALTLAEGWH